MMNVLTGPSKVHDQVPVRFVIEAHCRMNSGVRGYDEYYLSTTVPG